MTLKINQGFEVNSKRFFFSHVLNLSCKNASDSKVPAWGPLGLQNNCFT